VESKFFHEAWRIERDFYWDPAMTGHQLEADWGSLRSAAPMGGSSPAILNYLIGVK